MQVSVKPSYHCHNTKKNNNIYFKFITRLLKHKSKGVVLRGNRKYTAIMTHYSDLINNDLVVL